MRQNCLDVYTWQTKIGDDYCFLEHGTLSNHGVNLVIAHKPSINRIGIVWSSYYENGKYGLHFYSYFFWHMKIHNFTS